MAQLAASLNNFTVPLGNSAEIQFFANRISTGVNGNHVTFTGYQHARTLYLSKDYDIFSKYANVPKASFLYFVKFNVNNKTSITVNGWDVRYTALLTKSITLPKYKISTETLNQYNRKTNIQTKLSYEPIQIELHDDMNDTTNSFWINYYKYFYADTRYGDRDDTRGKGGAAFSDNKFQNLYYDYGFNTLPTGGSNPSFGESYFLDTIDIFVLHGGRYTKITLVNPMISAWDHDTVAQGEATKFMQNKMTIVYENVIYDTGDINLNGPDTGADLFKNSEVYDDEQSPLPITDTQPYLKNPKNPSYVQSTRATRTYTLPPYPQRQKSISLGSIISAVNKVRGLIANPRQAWNVYGINIKNELRNVAAGKIAATSINLTNNSPAPIVGTAKVDKVTNINE
jgi:hypothetical protein